MKRTNGTNNVCKYSESCFECPEKDCRVSQHIAASTNILPWDVDCDKAKKYGELSECKEDIYFD